MSNQALNLQTPATVWWVILLIGIAFIVGGLAIALNRIQERRPPRWKDATISTGPAGAGKSWIESEAGPRMVADPNGPFPRCKPCGDPTGSVCCRCGELIDPDNPNACAASDPCTRWRIEWPDQSKET